MSDSPPSKPLPLVKHAFSFREPREFAISSDKPSKTRQEFAQECDINTIMGRYAVTGVLDYVNKHQPTFEDVSALDFTTAMETVAAARSAFYDLPANVRDRFDNEPAFMLGFLENPQNRKEAEELGLVKRAETPIPATSQTTPLPTPQQPTQTSSAAS